MKAKRIKWRDRMPENDINYGGFLSYRHLKILGWFFLIVAQIPVILQLEAKLAPDTVPVIDKWNFVLSIFSGLPVPLFLLANLSTILQSRGNYKALFIKFGALAAGMYILGNFLVFHFGFRTMLAFNKTTTWADAARVFGELLPLFGKTGYTLNIFIDMLLVVLMFFFVNYVPKSKVFQGKRIILFRAMLLLPIAYEIAGIFLKYFISMGYFTLPSPVFFLLPSKPPLVFAAFVIIVLGLRLSEVAYVRREGNSQEKFEIHATTKAHSLKISSGIALAFGIIAIVDLGVYLLLWFTTTNRYNTDPQYAGYAKETIDLLIIYRMNVFEQIGFGGAIGLVLAIPIVFLFSYTKTHKNPKVDIIIPIAGLALIAVVLLEGFFQVITLNMAVFVEKLKKALEDATSEQPQTAVMQIQNLFSYVTNIRL